MLIITVRCAVAAACKTLLLYSTDPRAAAWDYDRSRTAEREARPRRAASTAGTTIAGGDRARTTPKERRRGRRSTPEQPTRRLHLTPAAAAAVAAGAHAATKASNLRAAESLPGGGGNESGGHDQRDTRKNLAAARSKSARSARVRPSVDDRSRSATRTATRGITRSIEPVLSDLCTLTLAPSIARGRNGSI
jgi:hypothetical protein